MPNRRAVFMAVVANQEIPYLLRDDFSDTLAAGSVNGTLATPTGGARVAVDTNSKLSIGSGVASFATGGAAYGNPAVYYSIQARTAGRLLIGKLNIAVIAEGMTWGYNNGQSSIINRHAFYMAVDGTISAYNNSSAVAVGALTTTSYQWAIAMRGTGAFWYIKGGAFSEWSLLFNSKTLTTNLYPGISGKTATVFTADMIRIPVETFIPSPLASDAFTRADGVIGATGGGGSEESGGSGLTWTAQKGTWGIATNKAACSELTDSLGIATVPCGTADVVAEVVATRTGGTSGLVLRYTDASNYIKAVHNGTNFQVIEVVAGTPNTLINAAATYGATARAMVVLSGTAVRAFYNEALVAAATTAVTTGNNHGLFTDDIGATFDNFVAWARGTEGQYSALSRFLA